MKVVIVAPFFPPHIGGVENYVYNIACGLKKECKWDVVIITTSATKKAVVEIKNGIKIYQLPYLFKVSNTPIHPLWLLWIEDILYKEKPDIVNAHTPVPFMADITAQVVKNIPFVLTYHNDIAKDRLVQKIIYSLYDASYAYNTLKKAAKIIVVSGSYAKKSPKLLPYLSKTVAISPGVDISLHNPEVKPFLNLAMNDTTVLFVAQLNKNHVHKGLAYLLDAIALVKKNIPSIQLCVLGDGDNRETFIRQTESLGIKDNVTFFGSVSDDELSRFYASCQVFVLPSYNRSEGFGMVVIEAGAHGKPVIGTRVGGIPYAIQHNKSGILIPPRDSSSLAKALRALLTDKQRAHKMGSYGYERVLKEFLWKNQVKKVDSLYKTLL